MNPFVKSFLRRILIGRRFSLGCDYGCGEGYYSDVLKEHCGWLIGVDHNLPRLSVAREYGFYDELVLADFCDFGVPEGLEAAFFLDSIEHVEKDRGFALLRRLLEAGVKFIFISTPETFHVGGLRDTHKSLWSEGELRSLGFTVSFVRRFPELFGREIVAFK